MGATSCYSCGATIEPNYYPKYCRRCGAKLRFFEEQTNSEANFKTLRGSISITAASKPLTDEDLKFWKQHQWKLNAPLHKLRTLWVSFSPFNSPFSCAEFEINSHNKDHNQSKNLERLFHQRSELVNKAVPIIEQQLKEAGLQVITEEEALASSEQSCLMIYLNIREAKGKIYYSVSIYLKQEVQLVREPTITFNTRTWGVESGDSVYLADDEESNAKKSRELLIAIKMAIDCFIVAYRFANDK